jgi:hypothetical protein
MVAGHIREAGVGLSCALTCESTHSIDLANLRRRGFLSPGHCSEEGLKFFPFVFTIFMFILACDML